MMNYNLTRTLGFKEFVRTIAKNRTDTKLWSKTVEKVDWCKCSVLHCMFLRT
jgi:hypothetical protein